MTLELIYLAQQAQPFEPFQMFLADGRTLRIANPEFAMLAADGRSVSVFQPPDVEHSIDPELIVSLQFGGSSEHRSL